MLLAHLETFAEAAERGSFTAAARHLGVTQAAISQRVQQLEAELRTPLFRRHPGGITLTDAGRRLHDYARRILDLTAEARAAVTGRRGGLTGDLRLAASSVPGEHVLPAILATFQLRHPGVRVKVSVSDTGAVLQEVEHGRAHLGFVGGSGGSPHLDFRRFADDELAVVVPRGHPWWGRRQVPPAALVGQPLVQREPASATRRCLEQALERAGVATTPNVVLELGSTEAIKEAVLAGLGVAVVSRRAVEAEIRAGRLRALRLTGVPLTRGLFVVRDRRRALPTAAQLFLDMAAAGV
jgi:DNA-binding transcriptional LysR family regulator